MPTGPTLALFGLYLLPLWGGEALYTYETDQGVPTLSDQRVPGARLFYTEKPLPAPHELSLSRFPLRDSFDAEILAASARHGVPAALIKAVCLAESGMNPQAVSRAGAMGLMQLMPSTAKGLGVSDPFDPAQSIDGGTRYLRQQIQTFGVIPYALAAYNAGPQNVIKHGGIPPFTETQRYVARVLDLYDHIRSGSLAPAGG